MKLVIGGGMAGLTAAWSAAAENENSPREKHLGAEPVLLLEKNSTLGRKLLLSGSTQCNVTHQVDSPDELLTHYAARGRFVKHALWNFSPQALRQFFEERGCALIAEANGKVFPQSRRASDILRVLIAAAEARGVKILCNNSVTTLTKTISKNHEVSKNHENFCVTTAHGAIYHPRIVIIACGGKSFPQTGSTGDGYALAASLGHTIIAPRVALASVKIANWFLASASGVAFSNAKCEVRRVGKIAHRFCGDILITHHGLSGPAILDASRFITVGDTLRINFLPDATSEKSDLDARLISLFFQAGKKSARRALAPLGIADSVLLAIFEKISAEKKSLKKTLLSPELKAAECSTEMRHAIVKEICACECRVEKLSDWNEAMVTAGGVDTREVNPKTMESRLVRGIFFAGEVLDVDGDCGGFNLQWGFSSGCCAAYSTKAI